MTNKDFGRFAAIIVAGLIALTAFLAFTGDEHDTAAAVTVTTTTVEPSTTTTTTVVPTTTTTRPPATTTTTTTTSTMPPQFTGLFGTKAAPDLLRVTGAGTLPEGTKVEVSAIRLSLYADDEPHEVRAFFEGDNRSQVEDGEFAVNVLIDRRSLSMTGSERWPIAEIADHYRICLVASVGTTTLVEEIRVPDPNIEELLDTTENWQGSRPARATYDQINSCDWVT